MNSKMSTNSQPSTTEPKKKERKKTTSLPHPAPPKKPKQTTGTGTESQKWRSHKGLLAGRSGERMGEKVQVIRYRSKKHKW